VEGKTLPDSCNDGELNTLCRGCWSVIEHKCSCPKEAITICVCENPKPLILKPRPYMETWKGINETVDRLEKSLMEEEPDLKGVVLDE
jgi:hypothetical protein